MKRIISILAAIILSVSLCGILAACGGGGSSDKAEKVQDEYAALVSEHNEVARLFDEASAAGVEVNPSAISSFNAAADYVNEFGAIELGDKSDEEMDEFLSDISKYRSNLQTLKSQLEALISDAGGDQQYDDADVEGDMDDEYVYDDEGEEFE